jgi:uncharacterized protein
VIAYRYSVVKFFYFGGEKQVDLEEQRQAQDGLRLTRRGFLRVMGGIAVGAAVTGAGGWTYVTRIEPDWVDVVNVELILPRLSAAFAGFRLAQVSDLHLGEALTAQKLTEAFEQLLTFNPDMIAITGDFVDDRYRLKRTFSELGAALRLLTGQVPVVAVLGNHDYRIGASAIREMLADNGVTELRNQVVSVEREGERLYIAGVDDVYRGRPRLDEVLAQIPGEGAAVLMAHEPDFADQSALTGRFDLQISGHSHGGQVVFPLIGPPVLPLMAEKYPSGLYGVNGMFQYTNRGLGTTTLHVRFNCRPEITIFNFQSPLTA